MPVDRQITACNHRVLLSIIIDPQPSCIRTLCSLPVSLLRFTPSSPATAQTRTIAVSLKPPRTSSPSTVSTILLRLAMRGPRLDVPRKPASVPYQTSMGRGTLAEMGGVTVRMSAPTYGMSQWLFSASTTPRLTRCVLLVLAPLPQRWSTGGTFTLEIPHQQTVVARSYSAQTWCFTRHDPSSYTLI